MPALQRCDTASQPQAAVRIAPLWLRKSFAVGFIYGGYLRHTDAAVPILVPLFRASAGQRIDGAGGAVFWNYGACCAGSGVAAGL